jgi:predicted lipoprotein with Yx(FWY)xxD motif
VQLTRRHHATRVVSSLVLAGCLGLAGCGSGTHAAAGDPALPQGPAATATVMLVSVPGLGKVLADGSRHVLYMFPPDAGGRVSCTGACAGTWPPLAIKDGPRPAARAGVNPQLLGTLPDPNTGGRAVTYGGYPLYRYAGDVDGGTANGQALFLNGGPWYALDANGQPITADPNGGS